MNANDISLWNETLCLYKLIFQRGRVIKKILQWNESDLLQFIRSTHEEKMIPSLFISHLTLWGMVMWYLLYIIYLNFLSYNKSAGYGLKYGKNPFRNISGWWLHQLDGKVNKLWLHVHKWMIERKIWKIPNQTSFRVFSSRFLMNSNFYYNNSSFLF